MAFDIDKWVEVQRRQDDALVAKWSASLQLADLDPRHSHQGWLTRAERAATSRLDVDRSQQELEYLEGRLEASCEKQAFQVLLQVYRAGGLPPEDVIQASREKVAKAGGISQAHAVALGWDSVAALTGER